MSPPRKFDYTEAQRLRNQGLSSHEIGNVLGVSHAHVCRVTVNPAPLRSRKQVAAKRWALKAWGSMSEADRRLVSAALSDWPL